VLPARKRKIPVAIANREKLKKITVRVPADLLAAAQKETGAGITETVAKDWKSCAARLSLTSRSTRSEMIDADYLGMT
jgi:hypothetical protein